MGQFDHLCGFIYHQKTQESLTEQCLNLFGDLPLESGAGKRRLLYQNLRKIVGTDWREIQQIGDCTPHGAQRCYVGTRATKMVVLGLTGTIPIPATEPLYAYSRVEIMGGIWKGRDGTSTSACIKAGQKFGYLHRQKYQNYDFTTYDSALARKWGNSGVPDDLDPIAEEDQLTAYYPSFSYEKARDLIYNGYLVAVSSNYGFESAHRDAKGRITPNGQWSHTMVFSAADDDPQDPCLLLDNRSWPDQWVSGPKRFGDEPEGTGWVRADDADKMLQGIWGRSKQPDSYAISTTSDFPSQAAQLDAFEMF